MVKAVVVVVVWGLVVAVVGVATVGLVVECVGGRAIAGMVLGKLAWLVEGQRYGFGGDRGS